MLVLGCSLIHYCMFGNVHENIIFADFFFYYFQFIAPYSLTSLKTEMVSRETDCLFPSTTS